MTTAYAAALADEINQRLEAHLVLGAIDFHADKVQEAGTTLKAFCPIHQDSRFRSLLIDAERKAFRCTIKTCQGYAGGSLVELYALSCNVSYLAAAYQLGERLVLELGADWKEQLAESFLADAAAAIGHGDYTEAETLLRELIGIMPDLPDARIMLASVMADLGDADSATEEYVKLIDHFLATDRTNDAANAADDAIRRFPDNEDLLFVRVKVAEKQGDNDLAISRMREILSLREAANRQLDNVGLLEQLVVKAPDEPQFALRLAALYEQQHNMRGASRQYENAARRLLATGETAEAIELLEKVVQFNTENTKARLDLARVLYEFGDVEKAREHTFKVVNQQIDQQEFGNAVKTVNDWLEREPGNIDARELLGRVFLDQDRPREAADYLAEGAGIAASSGDHSRAADLLLRAKFLMPDDPELRRRLIFEFASTGEQQRAAFEIIDLAEILFSSDQSTVAAELLGEGVSMEISLPMKLQMISSLANHGVTSAAIEYLQKLDASLPPDSPLDEKAEMLAVLLTLEPDQLETHIKQFEVLWQLSPERAAEAVTESAEHFLNRERYYDAIHLLELVTARLEGYVPAAGHLFTMAQRCDRLDLAGSIYQVSIEGFAAQDAEAALKAARSMAELDPNHPSAQSDIAFLLATLGRSEEASEQYARVAYLLREAGDYENALQYAREGAGLNPQNISALAGQALLAREILSPDETGEMAALLLDVTRESEDPEPVASGYLAYLELYPDDAGVLQEALNRLQQLGSPAARSRILARKAALLAAGGDPSAALPLLEEAKVSSPESPEILEQYGELSLTLGNVEDAAMALAEAARHYKSAGNTAAAAACATRAYEVTPDSVAAWETVFRGAEAAGLAEISTSMAERLTRSLSKTGPASSSARWAREWVRLAPAQPAAHEALGVALLGIDQKDNSAAALATAAQLYSEQKDNASALTVLARAADADIFTESSFSTLSKVEAAESGSPLSAKATLLLAHAEISRGNLAAARALADKLSGTDEVAAVWSRIARKDSDPTGATQAYLEAARSLKRAGKSDEAIAELQAATAVGQSDYEVNHLLASLLTNANRHEDALPYHLNTIPALAGRKSAEFNKLLKHLRSIHGDSADFLTRIARALHTAGEKEEALKDLEAAATLARATNNAAALVTICSLDEQLTRQSIVLTRARADALMGMENEQQALEWVRSSGRDLLSAGKAGEAMEMAQRWISLAPTDREAHRLYIDACEAAGDAKCAAEARLAMAQVLAEEGDLTAALVELQPLVQAQPPHVAALRAQADVQKALKQPEDAAATLAVLAGVFKDSGETSDALAALEESLALNPENSSALRTQADILRATQGVAAALPVYRQWIQVIGKTLEAGQRATHLEELLSIAPDSVWLLRDFTETLLGLGRYTEARPHLEHLSFVLETEGDYLHSAQALELVAAHAATVDPVQLIAIADLYEKAASPALAQEHLREATSHLMNQGNFAEAIPLLDRIIKLSGDHVLPEDYTFAAKAYARSGKSDIAEEHISKALSLISRVSGNKPRREALLKQALEISPLNPDYILQHMELLPAGRAMTEGLNKSRQLTASGRSEDAIQVLTQVIALAPHDMSVRQEIFAPLRQAGNKNRLRQELTALASDALAAGDPDAAIEALDEAAPLTETAAQHRTMAELNERARRPDLAAEHFISAALLFAEDSKIESAIANINRAISAKPSAVPADTMAKLVRQLGEPVFAVAREQLRSALTARRQKQSQVLALALLETSNPDRAAEILRTVNSLGGSTFVVGIAHQRLNQMLAQKDMAGALELAARLLEITPDSPDVWQLAARTYDAADMPSETRRSAVEAARLFHIAGAVTEEEDCYRMALAAENDLSVRAALAEYLVREHRQEEAVELLQENIAAAEAAGNTDLLIEYLNRAVQIAPANTDLREKLATLLEQFAPDSAVENWIETARQYMFQDSRDRAARVYKHILKLNPSHELALQELLRLADQAGDLVGAARYTSALATVKANRKNVGEAVKVLQSYLERDEDNLEILEQLASLAGTSNNADVFAATTRALAQKFQKSGKHEDAIRHYELLLERFPKDTRLLMALLDCSAAAGLPEKGAAFARQLLSVARETEDPERVRLAAATILNYDDSDPSAHNDLGESLLSLNRVTEAVAEWMRAGELFESTGNTAAAYTCYRRVTQVHPGTIQAWRRLSDLALIIGDIETARLGVLNVLEKSPDEKEAKRTANLLVRLLQALPNDLQVHQAALEFYRSTDDTEKAAEEYLWLAAKATAAGQNQQAEELLDEGLKISPGHPKLKSARYEIIRKMGRLEELQLRLRQEAEAHETAGNLFEAIGVVRELVQVAPGQISLHRELARLLEAHKQPGDALDQHLEVIKLQLEKGELEEAREVADKLAAAHPDDSNTRERIADTLAASAFPDAAARHYLAAAKIAQAKKQTDHSIELFTKATQARPSWADARSALAEACEKAGKTDQAFDAWIALTSILMDAGDFSEATATLDRLARVRPDSPEVRVQLAALYEKTGNREKQAAVLQELVTLYEASYNDAAALEVYRKLASIHPDDPAVLSRYVELLAVNGSEKDHISEEYTRLADVLARNGDFEAAFQTYEQVLGLNPENTSARSRYATFLLSRGSRNRALAEMRALSKLYMDRGEPIAAVEVLNAALTISPRDADLCLALAAAQEAAGFTEDARVSYARASAILASTAAVKGIDTYRRILTQDENNTAVRHRLVELLINSGDKMEAAREARILAEIHISRGELVEAEKAYRLVDECEPESLDDVRAAIRRDSYDPSLQYVHYVRLGNRLFDAGDIDNALDAFRTARSLHDDQPEIIQKCIDCVSLIAPEAEAIPDYLLMAEKLLLAEDFHRARQTYESVRQIDPFNNDARCGLETVNSAERSRSAAGSTHHNDDLVLKSSRVISKRVALRDLLNACQDASQDPSGSGAGSGDSQRLGSV